MDNQAEVREFLATRRAKLSPQQAGVPLYGTRRRVPGLRREEVAQLAGLSTDYYTRIEKGNLRSASESVLEAIARALQLDDAEHAHLLDLARAARDGARPVRRRAPAKQVRPSLQHLLDALTGGAAFVVNGRLDVLASNALYRSLMSDVFDTDAAPAEPRAVLLPRPEVRDASTTTGRPPPTSPSPSCAPRPDATPHDRPLTDLVGELATRSDEFRVRWARHDVRLHTHGTKRFRHPLVGELTLQYDTIPLPADPGLSLTCYTPEPATPSADGLAVLASWAATQAQPVEVRSSDG